MIGFHKGRNRWASVLKGCYHTGREFLLLPSPHTSSPLTMSFSERKECTGRNGPFTWQQRHRLSQKRAYTLSKWKNPRWLCSMLSWDIHSWAAQLSFSEEGLLWSTWKATQGRVLPRENPKKELNTTNVASSFTTAACCVSQRDQDRLLSKEQEILRPGCWWLTGKWCSEHEQREGVAAQCPSEFSAHCPFELYCDVLPF